MLCHSFISALADPGVPPRLWMKHLLCARLTVRTFSIGSFAGGRSNLVARPPAFNYQFNIMRKKKIFSLTQTKTIGEQLGIRWDKFDLRQFRAGLGVELEHGTVNPTTNVTNDELLLTGKIALAHLTEFPDYYTRLAKMEEKAQSFWDAKETKKTTSESGKRSGHRISAKSSAPQLQQLRRQ
jgi:hypothetical protein